mmetsp:Transcript_11116/g.25195  ORF Transcript_11116/g.25195 Transcript_11116/m.25195 type:complete len:85 (+) Transcript_11116:1880-2134(+)
MSRPHNALWNVIEGFAINISSKILAIHIFNLRNKQMIHSEINQKFSVMLELPWVFIEILPFPELGRVHEDRSYNYVIARYCLFH